MLIKKNKVRGYEVNIPQFGTLDEMVEKLGDVKLVNLVNAQLTAHTWNSAFEGGLADAAVEAGHKFLTETNEHGKEVIAETDAKFLKRVGFKLTSAQAQALADSIAYPPLTRARGPRVDAFTQVATMKVDAAVADDKLERLAGIITDKGYENDGTRDSVIAAYAAWLRDNYIA